MKRILYLHLAVLIGFQVLAQPKNSKYLSISMSTTQNAIPFSKFAGMFDENLHPGIEITKGTNFHTGKKHDWFFELRLAYFFHRFVQHGLAIYGSLGYRYKVTGRMFLSSSLGGGYQHSIPVTRQLKAGNSGNYENAKGIGRMQVIATFNLSAGYELNPKAERSVTVFTGYQQRVQFPFVSSYVPLLPYSSLHVGITTPLIK